MRFPHPIAERLKLTRRFQLGQWTIPVQAMGLLVIDSLLDQNITVEEKRNQSQTTLFALQRHFTGQRRKNRSKRDLLNGRWHRRDLVAPGGRSVDPNASVQAQGSLEQLTIPEDLLWRTLKEGSTIAQARTR